MLLTPLTRLAAYELGVLCSVDVLVVVFGSSFLLEPVLQATNQKNGSGHNQKLYEYCSSSNGNPGRILDKRVHVCFINLHRPNHYSLSAGSSLVVNVKGKARTTLAGRNLEELTTTITKMRTHKTAAMTRITPLSPTVASLHPNLILTNLPTLLVTGLVAQLNPGDTTTISFA